MKLLQILITTLMNFGYNSMKIWLLLEDKVFKLCTVRVLKSSRCLILVLSSKNAVAPCMMAETGIILVNQNKNGS